VQLLVARQVSQDGNSMLEEIHMWLAAVAAAYEVQQAGNTATLCSIRQPELVDSAALTATSTRMPQWPMSALKRLQYIKATLCHKNKHATAANDRSDSIRCLSVCV